MSNIATLGFDIDTAPLRKANDELNKLVKSAAAAEKAADKAGAAGTQAGNAIASGMQRAANAAQAAAAAMTGTGAAANAAAAAARVATAQGRVASATAASAQASAAAATAHNRYAQTAMVAANSNNILSASFLGVNASTLLSIAAMVKLGHEVGQHIDAYTQLGNALKVAGLSGEGAVLMEERLFAAAKRNGVAVDDLTQFYRRMAITQKEVGASNADVANMVDVVTAALRVQGTSSKAAAGALLQLSQSFGSGKVKAEEFNSIQEGALPLLQAAANGITKYKGSVAAMRQDVIAGNLSSRDFFEGILKGGTDLKALASTTKLTLSASFTAAGNSLTYLLGQMDKTAGISTTVSSALEQVSGWLDKLAKDPDFLNGLASAFQAFTGIVGMVKVGLEGVFSLLGGIADRIKEIMREKAAADTLAGGVTTNGQGEFVYNKGEDTILMQMKESTKAVDLAKAAMDRYKYSIDKARESGGSVTGAMVKNLKDATAEWEEAWDVYRSQKGQLEQMRMKAFNQRMGGPNEASPVTSEGLLYGPNLPPGWNDKPTGAGITPGGKHKGLDGLAKIKLDAQQYIEKQNEMTKAIGMTDEAASRLMHTQELRAKFQDANYPIEIEWINKTAAAMAKAEAEYKSATFWHDRIKAGNEFIAQQEIEYNTIGMSREAANAYRIEMTALLQAQREGKTVTSEQAAAWHESALAQAAAAEKVQRYADAVSFAKELSKGFFDDMREGLLNGLSLWDTFGKAAINVLNRIASKVMDMAIDGIFDMIFSPGKSSTGGAKAATGTSAGGSGGAGGLFGGLGDIFGRLTGGSTGGGGFWGSTISGNLPSGQFGPPAPGQNFSSGFLGDLTWGQGIGALGGLGAGAFNLATANGSTAKMIGGITSMVGAGVSLIPGIGQIAGPIIGLLGGILPGLFGDSKPEPPTMQGIGSLNFRNGSFSSSGAGYGGGSAIDMEGFKTGVGGLLDLAKAKTDKIKGDWSIQQQSYSKGDFSNMTTFVNGKQWGQSSDPAMQKQAVDTATANVAHSMMLAIGSGISDNMRQALSEFGLDNLQHAFSTDELGAVVNEINAFDDAIKNFGKTTTDAEKQMTGIQDSFNELFNTAARYKLAATEVAKIEAERNRQMLAATVDFSTGVADGLLRAQGNELQANLNALDTAKKKDLETNATYVKMVVGYTDQAANIEQMYYLQRNKLIEDANKEALDAQKAILADLDAYVKQFLPGGKLAGESATAHLSGLKAVYEQSMVSAQANPKDSALQQAFMNAGTEYGTYAKDYYGNNDQYIKLRNQLIADAQKQQAIVGGTPTVAASSTSSGNANTNNQFNQLMTTIDELSKQLTELMKKNAELTAKLSRYVSQP